MFTPDRGHTVEISETVQDNNIVTTGSYVSYVDSLTVPLPMNDLE